MKTIGILGGLGPEATVDYYREIIRGFNEINREGSLNYPEIIIFSVNMSRFIGFLDVQNYEAAAEYIAGAINKMAAAGADFAAISANTPHLLFPEISSKVKLPLISIVEACAGKARQLGVKRCGLLGTRFTMSSTFYGDIFQKYGIEVISPDQEQIKSIHQKLFTELEVGIFREETKQFFLGILEKMKIRDGIDSVILGCTEFPIMFTEEQYLDIPFLNTTRIHVHEIIKECIR